MSFLAPYTNVMRLGQGFNSYTQEICIDDAVLIHPNATTSDNPQPSNHGEFSISRTHGRRSGDLSTIVPDAPESSVFSQEQDSTFHIESSRKGVNQTVKYSSHAVDNVADIVDTLNISSSATMNYGSGSALGNSTFVKENNIGESDLSFLVSVKVTNESPVIPNHMEFNPVPGMSADRFSSVYGDSFIAGFLEGGEFSAVVSITVHDKSKISRVKTAAEVQLAMAASKPIGGGVSGDMDKEDVWENTEISVTVNWSGGGNIKKPKKNWDLKTVVRAASEFPYHVAKYSQRTSAILMNYNSLRSFQEYNLRAEIPFVVLDYRSCHLYTAELLSAFMYYKALWRTISRMIKDNAYYQAKECTEEVPNPIECDPRSLNLARLECRKYMTLIVEESRRLAIEPELGSVKEDGTLRQLPYKFPAELAMRLPRYVGTSPECSPTHTPLTLPGNLTDQRSKSTLPRGPTRSTACRKQGRTGSDGPSRKTRSVTKPRPRAQQSCMPFSLLAPIRWLSPMNWKLGFLRPGRDSNKGLLPMQPDRPRVETNIIAETSVMASGGAAPGN